MTLNVRKKVHLPEMPSVSAPDLGHITDELRDFAGAAADAVSSAAGHVPGLDDYRGGGAARRRRIFSIIGVVAVALIIAAVVRRRRQDDAAHDAAYAR